MKTLKAKHILPSIFILFILILTQSHNSVFAKTIELKLAHMSPIGGDPAVHMDRWAAHIEKESQGKLKIRVYGASTLLPGPEIYDGVAKGAADIGYAVRYKPTNYSFGMNITEMINADDNYTAMQIYDDIWREFPDVMAKEWRHVKVLWFEASAPVNFMTTKKVSVMDDLKGLQIRIPSKTLADMTVAVGATPVFMSSADFVVALDKGTVDGATTLVAMAKDFKFGPKIKSVFRYTLGMSYPYMVMNIKSYKKLPADLQKVIEDSIPMGKISGLYAWAKVDQDAKYYVNECGVEIIELTPDQRAEWDKRIKPVRHETAKKLDEQGYPGTRLEKFILERQDYYSKK